MKKHVLTNIVEGWVADVTTRADSAFGGFNREVGNRLIEQSPVDQGDFRKSWKAVGPAGAAAGEVTIENPVYHRNGSPQAKMIEHGGWRPPKFHPGLLRPVRDRSGRVVDSAKRTTPEGYSTQAPAGIVTVVKRETPQIWDEELRKAGLK